MQRVLEAEWGACAVIGNTVPCRAAASRAAREWRKKKLRCARRSPTNNYNIHSYCPGDDLYYARFSQ